MFSDIEAVDTLLRAAILSTLAVAWVTILVRMVGLRAFSKMTAIDFVVTFAVGSLLAGASQAPDWAEFIQATLAIAALLAIQVAVSIFRRASPELAGSLQNRPVLLMEDGKFIYPALSRSRVTEGDVIAKLREANVLDYSQVRAVVLETTGDVSVLHGEKLDDRLLDGVERIPPDASGRGRHAVNKPAV